MNFWLRLAYRMALAAGIVLAFLFMFEVIPHGYGAWVLLPAIIFATITHISPKK